MPNELLLRAKATPGSQTLGYHEPELQRWANVLPQASPIRVAPRYEAVGEQIVLVIQSTGQSQSSRSLTDCLRSSLAGLTGLASEIARRISMISGDEVGIAEMGLWTVKNRLRIRLIQKKHREGLNAEESVVLEQLKREISVHAERVAPRSTEVIDEFEAYVRGLKKRVAAKRRKKV